MSHTNRIDCGAGNITLEWFAFRVRPRHEKSVSFYLREKREECFVPLIRSTRTWAKRVAQIDMPLFSGYVFCRSHRFGLLPILKTPGVVDVIRAGNSPVPISTSEISALERAVHAAVPIEPCPYVEVGQKVEIRSGPLTGIAGIVSDRRKSGHLILSVSLLRRSVLVHIDKAHLYGQEHKAVVPERDRVA
jgi:transcription antitermination factor NusG